MKRKLKYRNKTQKYPTAPSAITSNYDYSTKYIMHIGWDYGYSVFGMFLLSTFKSRRHRRSRIVHAFAHSCFYSYYDWKISCSGRIVTQDMFKSTDEHYEVKIHEKKTQVQE